MYKGTYDIQASIAASSNFDTIVQNITADTPEQLIEQVREAVTQRKNASRHDDGEYSGGKGTYGSMFCKLEDAFTSALGFQQQITDLHKKIRALEYQHRPIKPFIVIRLLSRLTAKFSYNRFEHKLGLAIFTVTSCMLFLYWLT
jgi:hypothetical protein